MVISRCLFIFVFLSVVSFAYAARDEVTANIAANEIWEQQPIPLTVTILHEKADLVDPNSFLLNDKPIAAIYVKDVAFSGADSTVLSFYQLTLDGMPKGVQVLPSISVKVGNHVARSLPVTFEVKAMAVSPERKKAKLELKAYIEGTQPLYPGQRVRLVYRYIYNGNIELNKEILPLLDATGLKKFGATKVKDYEKGGFSIREVSQEVEAIKTGKFDFPSSHIEGYLYTTDASGGRVYEKPLIKADAAPVSLVVKDFPAEGKPASFNGAIGPFDDFSITLLSGEHVVVGDSLTLSVKISGKGYLDNVPLPELCCQPGFSGRFLVSDLPPSTSMAGGVKTFKVDMRPLSDTITEFPPVEFSYFDPLSQSYGILHSKAFPLTVVNAVAKQTPSAQPAGAQTTSPSPQAFPSTPNPIEIETVKPITESDLTNVMFGTRWVLWIIPLGTIVVAAVFYWKRKKVEQAEVTKIEQSPLYLKEALLAGPQSPRFIPLATKALLTRLVEKGLISQLVSNPEKIPDEGMAGEVRTLLLELDEHRFSGKSAPLDSTIVDRIQQIYKLI